MKYRSALKPPFVADHGVRELFGKAERLAALGGMDDGDDLSRPARNVAAKPRLSVHDGEIIIARVEINHCGSAAFDRVWP